MNSMKTFSPLPHRSIVVRLVRSAQPLSHARGLLFLNQPSGKSCLNYALCNIDDGRGNRITTDTSTSEIVAQCAVKYHVNL